MGGIKYIIDIVKEKLEFTKRKFGTQSTIKTNLIKGEVSTFFDLKKNLMFLFVNIFLTGLVVIAIYSGLVFWEKTNENIIQSWLTDIDTKNKKIKSTEEKIEIIGIFQKKLEITSKILKDHIYWTNFFKFLEDNTLSKIEYSESFSGNALGNYSISARAPDPAP